MINIFLKHALALFKFILCSLFIFFYFWTARNNQIVVATKSKEKKIAKISNMSMFKNVQLISVVVSKFTFNQSGGSMTTETDFNIFSALLDRYNAK